MYDIHNIVFNVVSEPDEVVHLPDEVAPEFC